MFVGSQWFWSQEHRLTGIRCWFETRMGCCCLYVFSFRVLVFLIYMAQLNENSLEVCVVLSACGTADLSRAFRPKTAGIDA